MISAFRIPTNERYAEIRLLGPSSACTIKRIFVSTCVPHIKKVILIAELLHLTLRS